MSGKVYVGNLDTNATDKDLEKTFGKYGPIKSIWIARKPPGFAFVTFEDLRDAEDACADANGKYILEKRCRVEISTTRDSRPPPRRDGGGGGYRGGRDYDDRDRDRGSRRRSSSFERYPRGGGRDRSRSPVRSRSRS